MTKGEPVPFRDGFPDFSKWTRDKFVTTGFETRAKDFSKANTWLAEHLGLKNKAAAERWLKANNLTWHHHQDGRTLELVARDVHRLIPHTGGIGLLE